MNNHEGISGDVYCPVDSDDIAEALLYFVCDAMGDTEKHMRVRVYNDAVEKLDRNPDAKIPGWPAMEALFGAELVMALRTVLMPGSDVSHLMKMAERYIYDETDNQYIDRDRFLTPGKYVHDGAELERRHKGDVVRIGGKPREAFKVFESSEMRKRIGGRNLYPDLNPGGIYRISNMEEVLTDDDEDPKALTMFNTWRGWPVSPTDTPREAVMEQCAAKLDQLLKYLTRDDENQARWMKSWIAWTIQNPGKKQQIAPVIVGGQGVGKSFLGNIFMPSLIGDLWGAASPKLLEGGFSIEPFVDKMVVFIDEARFHGDGSTEEIRKLIRNVKMGGAEKFQSAKTYNIYSRVMFASNRFDMNIGQSNVQDRALFYMKAYDKDYVELSEIKFRAWAETLKPWFEEFGDMLQRRDVREHYMKYFLEYPCTKNEVESIRYSSSGDADIVASNMSWTRRIAKYIVEDGRIMEDLDISYPFTIPDFNTRVGNVCKELGMQQVQGQRVLAEFREAGLLTNHAEKGRNYLKFTHKIGSLTDLFGEATMTKMEPRFQFEEDDYGPNDMTIDDRARANWRGLNSRLRGKV